MDAAPTSPPRKWRLTPEEMELIWKCWDEPYIVFQPSSTETHVFNDTTLSILKALEQGPLTLEEIGRSIVESLGIDGDALAQADLKFATERLEEIGLLAQAVEAAASP